MSLVYVSDEIVVEVEVSERVVGIGSVVGGIDFVVGEGLVCEDVVVSISLEQIVLQ